MEGWSVSAKGPGVQGGITDRIKKRSVRAIDVETSAASAAEKDGPAAAEPTAATAASKTASAETARASALLLKFLDALAEIVAAE